MEKVKPNKRVLAFLLDGVSFLFIISLSKYIFKFGDYNIIINIMFFLFFTFRDSIQGQSPGKYIIGLQVVDIYEEPISFLESFKRNVILFFPELVKVFVIVIGKYQNVVNALGLVYLGIYIIEYILATYSKDGTRLGDKIAKTRIKDLKPNQSGWKDFIKSIFVFFLIMFILSLFGINSLSFKTY